MLNVFRHPFVRMFSSLHPSKKQPTLLSQQLFDAVKAVQNLEEASTLFHYMLQLKPKPSVSHFHRLLTTIVKMGHYPLVVILFKKLVSSRCRVNEYFMGTLMSCYTKMDQVDLSFVIMGSFLKRGLFPNIVCVNWLIKGLFSRGDVEKAVSLFKGLVRRRVEINEFTLNIVLDGLCKAGEVVRAWRLLEMAEKNSWKVDVVGYNSMMDGFCKFGMLEDARGILSRMIDRNVLPNICTYTAFIDGLCKNGKLDFACTVFSDLPSKGVYPDLVTYTVIIQGLCKGGQFKSAEYILENMERVGFIANSVTCNAVLCVCLRHCDNFDSINLLKQIVGRDFHLIASTFFLLLKKIPEISRMRGVGVYDGDVINHLLLKLTSSRCIHETDNSILINSLIQKLS